MQENEKGSAAKRFMRPVPHEGEEGLFRQSWYALCKASDVPAGAVKGCSFLDGRVVIFRGFDERVQVLSAYCPHVGADLSLGTVTGDGLRCAFHGWEYGGDGRCLRTGIGDPPPRRARLFRFPTVEKYGVVWAFNGEQPLFELADPQRPLEHLLQETADSFAVATDPWVICSNTPDWSHFATVHRFEFPREGQNESLAFDEFGVRRQFTAALERGQGPEVSFEVTVRGVNQVLIEGELEGKWFGVVACLGLPRPGVCDFFITTLVDRREWESDEAARAALAEYAAIAGRMGAEDVPIWEHMHFMPGHLTAADKALSTYLHRLRKYPRAHPSADFIN